MYRNSLLYLRLFFKLFTCTKVIHRRINILLKSWSRRYLTISTHCAWGVFNSELPRRSPSNLVLNAQHILTSDDLGETFFSPILTPRVPDDPIFGVIFFSPSNTIKRGAMSFSIIMMNNRHSRQRVLTLKLHGWYAYQPYHRQISHPYNQSRPCH